jgi:hypothetical protein
MYSLEASTDQVSRNIISFLSRQMVTFLFLARVHGSVYPPHPKHILQKKNHGSVYLPGMPAVLRFSPTGP